MVDDETESAFGGRDGSWEEFSGGYCVRFVGSEAYINFMPRGWAFKLDRRISGALLARHLAIVDGSYILGEGFTEGSPPESYSYFSRMLLQLTDEQRSVYLDIVEKLERGSSG